MSLVLLGHVHNYQRTCAVWDGACTGGDGEKADGSSTAAIAAAAAAISAG